MEKSILNKKYLIILVGLPASGKSTFAKALKKSLESKDLESKVHIVDTDRIRTELFGTEFHPDNEPIVLQEKDSRIQALLQARPPNIVISDDLNYLTSQRQKLRQIAQDAGAQYLILYISTPVEKALEWNQNRENQVPDKVIRRINAKLDPPGKKYQWDTAFYSIDLTTASVSQAVSDFLEKLQTCEAAKIDKVTKNTEHEGPDLAEELELLSRKMIANLRNYQQNPAQNRIITAYLDTVEEMRTDKGNINPMELLNEARKEFVASSQDSLELWADADGELTLAKVLAEFMAFLETLTE